MNSAHSCDYSSLVLRSLTPLPLKVLVPELVLYNVAVFLS